MYTPFHILDTTLSRMSALLILPSSNCYFIKLHIALGTCVLSWKLCIERERQVKADKPRTVNTQIQSRHVVKVKM